MKISTTFIQFLTNFPLSNINHNTASGSLVLSHRYMCWANRKFSKPIPITVGIDIRAL